MKNLEKLNQLLEQEQCEFVGIEDGFIREYGRWVSAADLSDE